MMWFYFAGQMKRRCIRFDNYWTNSQSFQVCRSIVKKLDPILEGSDESRGNMGSPRFPIYNFTIQPFGDIGYREINPILRLWNDAHLIST